MKYNINYHCNQILDFINNSPNGHLSFAQEAINLIEKKLLELIDLIIEDANKEYSPIYIESAELEITITQCIIKNIKGLLISNHLKSNSYINMIIQIRQLYIQFNKLEDYLNESE